MRRRKASARCSLVTRGETGPPPKGWSPNKDNPPGATPCRPKEKAPFKRTLGMRPRRASACAKSLRRKPPASVNRHLSRTSTPANNASTSTDTIGEAIAMSSARCGIRPVRHLRRSHSGPTDFVLRAGNFLNTLPGGDIERLRSGLRFVFGDDAVHFVHVGGRGIVFEKRGIALRRKRQNFGIHIWSPVGLTFGFRGREAGGFGSLGAIMHP